MHNGGETAADLLDVNLNVGLTGTSVVTGVLLVIALVSVFGTLVTDNVTDSLNVPLEASTVIVAVLRTRTFTACSWPRCRAWAASPPAPSWPR